MDKVRIGIIGLGNMGSSHAANIIAGKCPEIELTAVADTSPEKLESFKNKFDCDVKLFGDDTEFLDSGLIDAVIIAVPHYFHPPLAIAAMNRGIHVMCEKPAGVYTKQVREMNEAAKKSGVVFGMMFNQRTDCIYRKLKELVDSGKYGALKRSVWIITNWYRPQAYYDSGDWRATWSGEGGGVLLNQCPHNLDLWQWICGMPTKISAHMSFGKWHDIEVEDEVTAYAEYADGATGTFITTTGDAPGTNRLELTLEGAKIVTENGKIQLWELEMSEPEFSRTNKTPFGHPIARLSEVETDGKNYQHVGVLNAFAGAILRGEPLIADGSEGINGLTISNAMHLSAWLGREIEIPFDEDLFYNELMKRVAVSRKKTGGVSVAADLSDTFNSGSKA